MQTGQLNYWIRFEYSRTLIDWCMISSFPVSTSIISSCVINWKCNFNTSGESASFKVQSPQKLLKIIRVKYYHISKGKIFSATTCCLSPLTNRVQIKVLHCRVANSFVIETTWFYIIGDIYAGAICIRSEWHNIAGSWRVFRHQRHV